MKKVLNIFFLKKKKRVSSDVAKSAMPNYNSSKHLLTALCIHNHIDVSGALEDYFPHISLNYLFAINKQ